MVSLSNPFPTDPKGYEERQRGAPAKKTEKSPFRYGFRTLAGEERNTRFPFPIPSQSFLNCAGNGREKGGAVRLQKKGRKK